MAVAPNVRSFAVVSAVDVKFSVCKWVSLREETREVQRMWGFEGQYSDLGSTDTAKV